ncbi:MULTISPECIES: Do family serine endopeptidase [Pedobacter]|uniref:Do family serine endopeptidase n=1 Tax=Pedobacter TaxID=84567 RepID=UPI00210B1394|nr:MULTISPECIES: Do family serine endopeptidase [unclassified Pedobacter]
MKKMGVIVLAAFIGGAAAIGGYKMLEPKQDALSFEEQQKVIFANNPKLSSAGTIDFVEAAAAVSPAVVHIKTSYGSGAAQRSASPFDMFEDFFGGRGGRRMPSVPRAASGSGVILTPDGYIVTNNHVIDNASKIEVILSDRRKVSATVVGKDANTDLALIKVEANNLPAVRMGNSDNVQIGEWVLAVGFPLDLQTTVTAGIVSAKARSIGILAQNREMTEQEYEEYQRTGKAPVPSSIESFIQTDAAINPGNSGGALVNAAGELIGINAAIASRTGTNEGYGFAIPINLAKKILDDFRKYGAVKRGYIGVSFAPLDADQAEKLDVKDITGLYVSEVMPNSAAAAAGLQKGDIIKKVDGNVVYDSPDLQEKIGRMSPGDKVQLTYSRNGQMKNVTVTLKGESSVGVNTSTASASGTRVERLGASFAPAPADMKAKFGVKNGVIVTNVEQGKAFDSFRDPKGLVITSVNGKPVNSAGDVKAAMSSSGTNTISGVSARGSFSFTF